MNPPDTDLPRYTHVRSTLGRVILRRDGLYNQTEYMHLRRAYGQGGNSDDRELIDACNRLCAALEDRDKDQQ